MTTIPFFFNFPLFLFISFLSISFFLFFPFSLSPYPLPSASSIPIARRSFCHRLSPALLRSSQPAPPAISLLPCSDHRRSLFPPRPHLPLLGLPHGRPPKPTTPASARAPAGPPAAAPAALASDRAPAPPATPAACHGPRRPSARAPETGKGGVAKSL